MEIREVQEVLRDREMKQRAMSKCPECQVDYPDWILSPMTTSQGRVDAVCGICALATTNAIHNANRTSFQGETAEWMRQAAIEHRESTNQKPQLSDASDKSQNQNRA